MFQFLGAPSFAMTGEILISSKITGHILVGQNQLEKPEAPTIAKGVVTWEAAQNESSGYSLQLYKDGAAFGAPVIIAHEMALSYDIKDAVTAIGDYSAAVKVLGNGIYADSPESDKTIPYCDYIEQFNLINNAANIMIAVEDGRLNLHMNEYNLLTDVQKNAVCEDVLSKKGSGYLSTEAIQSAVDQAVAVCLESPETVYVSTEYNNTTQGYGSIKFDNIFPAIEKVAENGTVNVSAGKYYYTGSTPSTFYIQKNVTVIGDNMDNTTIRINCDIKSDGLFHIRPDKTFNLSNITIDGKWYDEIQKKDIQKKVPYAIFINGGSANISNVKIKNIKTLNNYACGIKVVKNSLTLLPRSVTIDGCVFENIYTNDIYVQDSEASIGTAACNTFIGDSGNSEIENKAAIYVSGQSNVKIYNNKIDNYTRTGASGICILYTTTASTAEIVNNALTNCFKNNAIHISTGSKVRIQNEDSTLEEVTVTADNAEDAAGRIKSSNNGADVGIYARDSSENETIIYPH